VLQVILQGECAPAAWTGLTAVMSFVVMFLSAQHFGHHMIRLLNSLPENEQLPRGCISWGKVWAGMVVEKTLTIAGLAVTMLKPDITWAGIRYWKAHGRVVKVLHSVEVATR
jgi:hypothetical protein